MGMIKEKMDKDMKKGFTRNRTNFQKENLRGRGFTLTELLIVVSILILLMLAVLVNWKLQVDRARDTIRKKNLNDIKRAFEEYYNDKNCYPPLTILSNCNGPELQPYMTAVPCDPDTKLPYKYVPIDETIPPNLCLGYRAFTELRDVKDTDIGALGCNGITGCGYGSDWNYGISSGGSVALPGFDPGAMPTPTPAPPSGSNACDPGGTCNSYGNPVPPSKQCPVTYASNCTVDSVDQCQFLANRCVSY